MLNIVLFEPEIPPNTGNIMRLCSNSGSHLHLIHPLGFNLNEKSLRRAGMDYRELAVVTEYKNYSDFIKKNNPSRIFACSTKGTTCYSSVTFHENDFLLFGPETRGLPDNILQSTEDTFKIRIPMKAQSRSINLSNAVAIILFEAWRQLDFN